MRSQLTFPQTPPGWASSFKMAVSQMYQDITAELRSLRWIVEYVTYSGTTPVGNVVPGFIGQELLLNNAGTKTWWKSTGTTNTNWLQIG